MASIPASSLVKSDQSSSAPTSFVALSKNEAFLVIGHGYR